MSDLRMYAYYYGFDRTGEEAIDRVLSAVACAGKSYHHTESWAEESEPYAGHSGNSPVEWIQNAANAAAAEIARLRAALELIVTDHEFCGDDWGDRREAWIETARAALNHASTSAEQEGAERLRDVADDSASGLMEPDVALVRAAAAALERLEALEEAHSELAAKWARRAVRTHDATTKYEIRRCISELAISTDATPTPAPQQGGSDDPENTALR